MCQPPNLRKTCYAEISVASHGIYRVFHSLLSSFSHFFFSFQIYHSPIHKQAESKSVIIPPHIWSYHIMTCGQIHTVMSHVTHQVPECIRVHVFTKYYIKMFLVKPGGFFLFFLLPQWNWMKLDSNLYESASTTLKQTVKGLITSLFQPSLVFLVSLRGA